MGWKYTFMVIGLVLLSGLAGYIIRTGQLDCEQCIMGYHDKIIDGITQMSRNCAPSNVEAFEAISVNGEQWGVMLVCHNNTNISMSMRYYR